MAVSNEDLARLVVSLEATTTKYYNALRKAQQQTNSSANAIERRLTSMATNIDRTFANLGRNLSSNITGPLAAIGGAFSVREVLRYADAWTEAGNQLAASSDITGIQARSLSDLRKVADDSRAGFEETVKLYTRIQRSAGDVANSEEDIARATGIVNKAFKAGGAATSEFNAGILQLSQGLGSGVLQGDELRSVRENAPVLAKVIADYFGVTIAGLKELGSQGKLTSEEVFKAILAGEQLIESAFGTTQATIADGFTKVRNSLIEYIGSADQSAGVTIALNTGLNALADNFNVVADAALKLAALIAGALVGRSLVAMIGSVITAGSVIKSLITGMNTARVAALSLSTGLSTAALAAGPLAAVIGSVAFFALQALAAESAEASSRINATVERMTELGFSTTKTTQQIREQTTATDDLTEAERKLNEGRKNRENIASAEDINSLRFGNFGDNLRANLNQNILGTRTRDLSSLQGIIDRSRATSGIRLSENAGIDEKTVFDARLLAQELQRGEISAKRVQEELQKLQLNPNLSQETIDLIDAFSDITQRIEAVEGSLGLNNTSSALEALEQQVRDFIFTRETFAKQKFGNEESVEELETLRKKIEENDLTAEELIAELTRLQNSNPDLRSHLSTVQGFIDKIYEAIGALKELRLTSVTSELDRERQEQNVLREPGRENLERERALNSFIAGQRASNSLAKEERDLREEIDKIVNNYQKTGQEAIQGDVYANERLRSLAAENLALIQSDRASTKSDKDSARDIKKFQDAILEQERSNNLLQEELTLRAGLNPLIEDYGYAIEKWRKQQELLNAAEDAGIALTPDLENKIGLIAEAYASGTAALEKLQETQDKARESLQEWLDLAKSATRSFIDDLIEGKSAAEALSNVLGQLGSKLIDIGLNTLFGGSGGSGGQFGIFGQLFSGFGGFRERGGPVTRGQAYVVGEKRPEVFVPNQSGVIIPRVPTGISGGGGTNVPIAINIDATGADSAGLTRVRQEVEKLRSELPYMIQARVSNRAKKGW